MGDSIISIEGKEFEEDDLRVSIVNKAWTLTPTLEVDFTITRNLKFRVSSGWNFILDNERFIEFRGKPVDGRLRRPVDVALDKAIVFYNGQNYHKKELPLTVRNSGYIEAGVVLFFPARPR